MAFQQKPMRNLTDTDFSLSLKGLTPKDDLREPFLSFKVGDKLPAVHGTFLKKDGKGFSQSFISFKAFLKFLGEFEALIMYPGTDKISKTFTMMRAGKAGAKIPSGTKIHISRRKDGAVSIRLENREIRDAIFPVVLDDEIPCETRYESMEPRDPRDAYMVDALVYMNMIRNAGYLWKHELTKVGNAEERERIREHFNGSNNFG